MSQRPYSNLFLASAVLLLAGCVGSKNVALEGTFPVPLMDKIPVSLAIHLDEELLGYIYQENLEKEGEWNVNLGSVQTELFENLSVGLFEAHALVGANAAPGFDGVLKPKIDDLQFSLPAHTRSNFYEVWIRYSFELYDSNGNSIGTWPLPAYGKASKRDFGSASTGVEAAAIAACRDAMAFFALNFAKVPQVRQWLANGKPQLPPPPPKPAGNTDGTDAGSTGEGNSKEGSATEGESSEGETS